jgi:hypothetical protein
MISPAARRIAMPGALLCVLWLQTLHRVHPLVICKDGNGARMECADLVDRCPCHIHGETDDAIAPQQEIIIGETPFMRAGGTGHRCTDTAISVIWRGSRGIQLAFSPTASSSPAPEAWPGLLAPMTPAPAPGPSPPVVGMGRHSRLFSWRC